jgi:hypothetical protein
LINFQFVVLYDIDLSDCFLSTLQSHLPQL